MKALTSTFIAALIFLSTPAISQKWKNNGELIGVSESSKKDFMGYKELPKKARHFFEDMKFIPMGSFTSGYGVHSAEASRQDSCLVLSYHPARVSLDAFFMSDHEVTNAEYREFTNWVREKTAREILARHYPEWRDENGQLDFETPVNWNDSVIRTELYYPTDFYFFRPEFDASKLTYSFWIVQKDIEKIEVPIYPDTTSWVAELPYSFNEPMVSLYFWHPAYDDYPVVGISYYQAMAYCDWKTDRLNEEILIANKLLDGKSYSFTTYDFVTNSEDGYAYVDYLYPRFRLPTEAEWEWAATGGIDHFEFSYSEYSYQWKSEPSECKNGLYQANFGNIIDRNGVSIKGFSDDGYMTTSEIRTYNANEFDLYDMLGNVAEWVADIYPDKYWENMAVEEFNPFRGNIFEINDSTDIPEDESQAEDILEGVYIKVASNERSPEAIAMDSVRAAYDAYIAENDASIFKAQNPARIVKGGSWFDGPIYLNPSVKAAHHEKKKSCMIGFRVVMSYDNNEYMMSRYTLPM